MRGHKALKSNCDCCGMQVVKRTMLTVSRGQDITKLAYDRADAQANECIPSWLTDAMRHMGVTVLDPAPSFAARSLVPNSFMPLDAAGLLYRDDTHLSNHGSFVLYDLLKPVFAA